MVSLPRLESDRATLHPSPSASPALETLRPEPIALIGMGCRFPGGANTPEAFWQLLRNGVDTVSDIPATRWDVAQYYDPDRTVPGKMYVRTGAFLDEVDQFDPQFFRMAPREATHLDPQQRLLLEVSWEALEYAGLAPARLAGSQTGVFVGSFWDDYAAEYFHRAPVQQLDAFSTLSSLRSMVAGRIAHALDLHGPTMQVDTACSSSLLAVHLACQSLRNRECDLALAGGVSLILSPQLIIGACKMNALSTDGRCKTFAANADGFGRGEGCGMVVLKRFTDARQDGDPILALIRGSATNHDGRSLTLTTPDSLAQQAVVRQALANAQLEPQQVQYVEAHGTGTPLGDPIELSALGKVFGPNRQTPLMVGSVKTNIGHLDSAAGVSGLIKVVLALTHSEIPPNLHFWPPNPLIPWHNLPVTVPTQRTPWQGQPKIAGISAFGMSGANVHLLVEEAPTQTASLPSFTRPYHLLPLSARDEKALADLLQRYARFLANDETPCLADICYTAAVGRSHFEQRLAIVAESTAQLQAQLAAARQDQPTVTIERSGEVRSAPPAITFLFTGQGSQYVEMGRELYETQPTFRATLDRCDELLRPQLGVSLLSILYPASEQSNAERINDTTYTQPALFALEYALATLWQAWGIQPTLLIGHSVGELVAACVAGVFSLEEGLRLVAARGRLMGALPQDGAMVAITASEIQVRKALAPYSQVVALAAVNGPENMVISGQRQAVLAIAEQLAAEGVKTQQLTVSHAFHSPLMEPMLEAFRQAAATITYHSPDLPLVSNLTGKLVGDEIMTPEYWVRQVRAAVRFADGVTTLHEHGTDIFLEIGPKPVLIGMAQSIFDFRVVPADSASSMMQQSPIPNPQSKIYLPSLRQGHSAWRQMLTSLGELYMRGVNIDWVGFDKDYHHKVVLPTYPFQRKRYWANGEKAQSSVKQDGNQGENQRQATGGTVETAQQNQQPFHGQAAHQRPASFSKTELPIPAGPYRLEITERGLLEHLQWKPVARRSPAHDEVEIQVQASGLGFRDVLDALGMYPGEAGPLGGECAGVIVAVGAGVTDFAVGDPVLALAFGSLSRYVIVSATLVAHNLPTLSLMEAATIPSAFLTAYYGLYHLAQMKPGDRVLIHAAAGGVGMAAVQFAQQIGAEVFATASPGKWHALRELGVTHLYHSRTLDFAGQIMADTEGQGVDILLNSLTGSGFMEANLTTLAPRGYLLEMSKRNVWSMEQIAAVRPDIAYAPFDLSEVASQQPLLVQKMITAVMRLFEEGKLRPLPYMAFPIQEAVRAFRTMQQAKHMGKVILTAPTLQHVANVHMPKKINRLEDPMPSTVANHHPVNHPVENQQTMNTQFPKQALANVTDLSTLLQWLQQVSQQSTTEIDLQIDEIKGVHFRITPQFKERAEGEYAVAPPVHSAQPPERQAPPPTGVSASTTPVPKRQLTPVAAPAAQSPTNSVAIGQEHRQERRVEKGNEAPQALEKQIADVDTITLTLKQLLADILYFEDINKINARDKFTDQGMDSVTGVEFINKINRAFTLQLKAVLIYDYSTIQELSTYIASELGRKAPLLAAAGLSQPDPVSVGQNGSSPTGLEQGEVREILLRVAKGELTTQAGNAQIEQIKAGKQRLLTAMQQAAIDKKGEIFTLLKTHMVEILPQLGDREIEQSSTFDDLGFDSVEQAEILVKTMERLGLNSARIDFAHAKTVDALAEQLAIKSTTKAKQV